MGDGYNFQRLRAHILGLSAASDWETARKEWAFVHVFESDEPNTCPCGHYPIIEICGIRNRITKQATDVGNVCVRRFLGYRSDLIFKALKKIRKDDTKSLNADAITFFYEWHLLTNWEYRFLQSTMRKRSLSPAQAETRQRINKKILEAVRRRGFQGPS
jgi:hypothetical protein